MKTVLKYFFRMCAVIGFGVLLVSLTGWGLVLTHKKPKLPDTIILGLDFTKDVRETEKGGPLNLLGGHGKMTLRDVETALDLASKDTRVKMVIADFRGNVAGLAEVQELRESIWDLRNAGKLAYAFSTSFGEFGPADHAYYLASAFNKIWLQPMGLVGITGLAAQMPFARGALDKIGAQPDFLHREQYKTAMDSLTETAFTEANAEMLGSILDDISGQMVEDIARDRNLQTLDVFRLIDQAPLTADYALQSGIIDHIGYLDQIEDGALKALGDKAEEVTLEDYLSMRRNEMKVAKAGKDVPVVAYIHGTGQIVQDADGPNASSLMSADDIVSAVQDAVKDKKVEAILLRLDSPGGSAVASESIRRALNVAQDSGIPVVVSMGEMAGSGAYWVAAQADMVFADPATLTSSIGVIAGKVAGTEIWNKLGINWGMIKRGENADLWTVTAPFTPDQRLKVDELVGEVYDAFKLRVAEGRELSADEVTAVAKGRVWTGRQALALGLVDQLGGLYDSIRYMKSLLGVDENAAVTLKNFPAEEDFGTRITKLLDRLSGMSADMGYMGHFVQMMETVFQPVLDLLQPSPRQLMMQDYKL